jgi:hypothetical protein
MSDRQIMAVIGTPDRSSWRSPSLPASMLYCFSGAWIGQLNWWRSQGANVHLAKRIPYRAACSILTIADGYNLESNVFTPESWRVRNRTSEILDESRIVNLQPSIVTNLFTGSTQKTCKAIQLDLEGNSPSTLRKQML